MLLTHTDKISNDGESKFNDDDYLNNLKDSNLEDTGIYDFVAITRQCHAIRKIADRV